MVTGLIVTLAILIPFIVYEAVLIIIRKNKPKFAMKQKNWWLTLHIFFTAVWFGGALGSLLLLYMTTITTNHSLIYAAHLYMDFFDKFLNIPGSIGSLVSGIVISLRTHWGITQYYWIITKLVANIGVIYFGGGALNDWAHKTLELAESDINILKNPIYLQDRDMMIIGFIASTAVLIFVVAISKFKPWGKRKKFRTQKAA